MKSPVNIAILGAGYISEWHAKAIQRLRNVRLTAVCDKSQDRANALAGAFRVPLVFSDLELLSRESRIDSVHILLPPDLHYPAAKKLLESGKRVFIEKPMCLAAEECKELTQLAEGRGLRIAVGHNFLFHNAYEPLRRDVQSGQLGWVTHVTVTWHKELPQLRHGPFGIWMLREPTNVLFEIGSHAFAYVNDLVGSQGELSVTANNPRILPTGISVPRNWHIILQGEQVMSTISLGLASGFSEHSVHVRGTLGSATADLERNTYVLRSHQASADDFDRYHQTRQEANKLRRDGYKGMRNYLLSKFMKRIPGNAYGQSIQSAIEAFYAPQLDERLSGNSGKQVIELCSRARDAVRLQYEIPQPSHAIVARPLSTPPKILVLGASGFIGQELCRQLTASGHSVRVLIRDPSKLPAELRSERMDVVRGDLESQKDVSSALIGIDYVFHLARATVKTWAEYTNRDVNVTKQIALACMNANVKLLVYTGTIDSYYAGSSAATIREDTPYDAHINHRNLYARCKAASEDLLMQLHHDRKLPVVIVRPGIVIGRGGSPFHWGIGMWHYEAVCQVWGDGKNKLPLVLVEDVASGLIRLLLREDLAGKSFNLVGDPLLSAEEYLDELESYTGIRLGRQYVAPWRFYVKDIMKWVAKCIVRHPERRLPSYRDWESRTQRATFDCAWTKRELEWNPETNRDVLVKKGIHVAVDEIKR